MDQYKSPTRIYVKCLHEVSDQFAAFTIPAKATDPIAPNDGDIALLEGLSPKIKNVDSPYTKTDFSAIVGDMFKDIMEAVDGCDDECNKERDVAGVLSDDDDDDDDDEGYPEKSSSGNPAQMLLSPILRAAEAQELEDEIAREYLTMDEYNAPDDSGLSDSHAFVETMLDEEVDSGIALAVKMTQTMTEEEPDMPEQVNKTTQTIQSLDDDEESVEEPSRNPVDVFWRFMGRDPAPAKPRSRIQLKFSDNERPTTCICDDATAPNGEAIRGIPIKLPSTARYSRSSKKFVQVRFDVNENHIEEAPKEDQPSGSKHHNAKDATKSKKGSFSRLRSFFSFKS